MLHPTGPQGRVSIATPTCGSSYLTTPTSSVPGSGLDQRWPVIHEAASRPVSVGATRSGARKNGSNDGRVWLTKWTERAADNTKIQDQAKALHGCGGLYEHVPIGPLLVEIWLDGGRI